MAYRDESDDVLEAPTAEGTLRLEVAPRAVKLTVGSRTLHVVEHVVTVVEEKRRGKLRRESIKIARLVIARDVPHEDLGVWVELEGGWRRIFGVEPVNLLEPSGLPALATLDRLVHKLRAAVADHAGDVRRAVEIGRGLDKVLLADHGDRFVVYARRLFRDRARYAMTIREDGRIELATGKKPIEFVVRSKFGVTVHGDYIRFSEPDGKDLGRFSIPWIEPEDRIELARRIGQLVDAEPVAERIEFPYTG